MFIELFKKLPNGFPRWFYCLKTVNFIPYPINRIYGGKQLRTAFLFMKHIWVKIKSLIYVTLGSGLVRSISHVFLKVSNAFYRRFIVSSFNFCYMHTTKCYTGSKLTVGLGPTLTCAGERGEDMQEPALKIIFQTAIITR